MLMESTAAAGAPAAPLRDRLAAILRDRRALLLLGTVPVAAGLAWQWSWLTTIGVVPFVLSVAPCAAMCALGLCMAGKGARSCPTRQAGDDSPAASTQAVVSQPDEPVRINGS